MLPTSRRGEANEGNQVTSRVAKTLHPQPHAFSPSAYTQQAKTMMSRSTLLSLLALAITPTATLSSASISILDAHYPWDDQPLGFSLDKFDFTTSFGDKRTASLYIPAKGKKGRTVRGLPSI